MFGVPVKLGKGVTLVVLVPDSCAVSSSPPSSSSVAAPASSAHPAQSDATSTAEQESVAEWVELVRMKLDYEDPIEWFRSQLCNYDSHWHSLP